MTTGGRCMAHKRGDVLLVPFPFSDLSTTKVRPAVVVSSPTYHKTEPDLLLAAVTSNTDSATQVVDYVLRNWEAAGLRLPSAFKPILFMLDPDRVIHRIGSLTRADLREVDKRLKIALGLS